MKALYVLLPLLCGCALASYIGAVPKETFNAHVEEVESFSKESIQNQSKIAVVAVELATENVLEAKQEGDDAKLERSIGTKVRAELAGREAEKLSEVKFQRDESKSFDGSGIMGLIGSALGGNWMELITGIFALLAGGKAYTTSQKLSRVKDKAKKFATTPDTFDISNDKDLA